MKKIIEFKKKLLYSILRQPRGIKVLKSKIIIFNILATLIFDAMAFSLKGSEIAMQHELSFLAILLLILYFSQRTLESSFITFADLQDDNFTEIYSAESISIIMQICNVTNSKVFKKNSDGNSSILEKAEIIEKTKDYLQNVWNFWWKLPEVITEIVTLLIMITIMIFIEVNSKQSIIILFLLATCIIIYIILEKKRINFKKSFRKISKESKFKYDILYTEIKSIDFISQDDFEYHAEKLKKEILNSNEISKRERLNLNKVFIQRSIIASGFMIAILVFKVITVSTLNIQVLLDIVAISSIYSTILSKIGIVLEKFESIMDIVIDINTLHPDFKNINSVYEEEMSKVFEEKNIDSIYVGVFKASQDPEEKFVLQNSKEFELSKSDSILIHGHTGCGKSTLLFLLTGKLRVYNNPIKFSNGKNGYLKSIAYQTDKSMANNFVINEIILNDDINKVDQNKLLEILKGLKLYDEILNIAKGDLKLNISKMSKNEKIFAFLRTRKTSQFSSGQKQRLALAKLLYTMTKEHQVIALDEAFNRLDDSTAKDCIKFVYEYTQKDFPRIVLFATHQVELVRPFCNKEISFEEVLNISEIQIQS